MRTLPDPPFRAAILGPSWLGDSVMTLALVPPLAALSGNPLEVWTPPTYRALYEGRPDVQAVLDYGGGPGDAFALRGSSVEVLFLLRRSFSSALSGLVSGVPHRIGWRGEGRSPLLTHRLPNPARFRHWIDGASEMLSLWPDLPSPAPSSLQPRFDPNEGADTSPLAGTPYVVFVPGATFGPAKRWRGFAELAGRLNGGFTIALAGSRAEEGLLLELAMDMKLKGRQAKVFAGNLNLPALGRLMRDALFTVSNDTGPMHLAAAVGGRCLGLFLSTEPSWTAPRGPQARHLTSGARCRPCYQRTCPLPAMACQDDLSVDDVLAATDDWRRP